MSDESYRRGFLDGFKEGWEKASKQEISIINKCNVCGKDLTNSWDYVCVFTSCPRYKAYSVSYSTQFDNVSSSNSDDLGPFIVKP